MTNDKKNCELTATVPVIGKGGSTKIILVAPSVRVSAD